MTHAFKISDAINHGVDEMRKHWKVLLAPTLIIVLASFISNRIQSSFYNEAGLISTFTLIVFIIINLILTYNLLSIALTLHNGHSVNQSAVLEHLTKNHKRLFNWLLANIIYIVICSIGALLFIVPGIYLATRYSQINLLLLDKKLSIKHAFEESAKMTEGHKLRIFYYLLLVGLCTIVGYTIFEIGAVPVYMISAFAGIYIYKRLLKD